MDQIDRRIGLQQIAPHPLAGMGLARHQQHPQPVAHARHRHHGAIVLQGQFGGPGRGRQFDEILAFMRHRHAHVGVLAHRHQARAERLAVDADIQHRRWFRRCRPDHRPAGASSPIARQWRSAPHSAPSACGRARRACPPPAPAAALAATSVSRRRRVMHLAIGDQDGAGHPARRHIGQRRVQGGEGLGAVILAGGGGGDAGLAHDQIGLLRQQALDLRPRALPPARRARPALMLCERSVTITATSGSGACFSFTSSGPARANSRTAKARPRAQAPARAHRKAVERDQRPPARPAPPAARAE